MQVDVKHGLACCRVTIHDDPVAGFGKSLLRCNFLCCDKKLADDFGIGFNNIVHRCNMASRDDQNMCRCLGINIPKPYDLIRLINDIGVDIACRYFAKKAIWVTHGRSNPSN